MIPTGGQGVQLAPTGRDRWCEAEPGFQLQRDILFLAWGTEKKTCTPSHRARRGNYSRGPHFLGLQSIDTNAAQSTRLEFDKTIPRPQERLKRIAQDIFLMTGQSLQYLEEAWWPRGVFPRMCRRVPIYRNEPGLARVTWMRFSRQEEDAIRRIKSLPAAHQRWEVHSKGHNLFEPFTFKFHRPAKFLKA